MKFEENTDSADIQLETVLQQQQYDYMMSMTIMVNETTCTTRNPTYAANDCNLFRLEEVFMLYFEIANMAKFHFFATKNYYESQSKAFFIPYDQWVTIQIAFSQYGGFQIIVGDQNGKVIYTKKEERNMHSMRPTGKLDLFRSFEGYVESFILDNKEHQITNTDARYLTDFRSLRLSNDTLLNLSFLRSDIEMLEGTMALNRGIEENVLLRNANSYEWIFFEMPNGQTSGVVTESVLSPKVSCRQKCPVGKKIFV